MCLENSEQYEVTADRTSDSVTERKKPQQSLLSVALIVSLGNLISAYCSLNLVLYGNGILAVILMLLIIAALFVIVMYLIIRITGKQSIIIASLTVKLYYKRGDLNGCAEH